MESRKGETAPNSEQLFYAISDYLIAHGEHYGVPEDEVGGDVDIQEYSLQLDSTRVSDLVAKEVTLATIAYSDTHITDLATLESDPATCTLTIHTRASNWSSLGGTIGTEQRYEITAKNGGWDMSVTKLSENPALQMSPEERIFEYLKQRPRSLTADERDMLATIAMNLSDYAMPISPSNP